MNALTWSMLLAALMFGEPLFAAEKPSSGETPITVKTKKDAPKSDRQTSPQPWTGKIRSVGPGQFQVEIMDGSGDGHKTKSGKADASVEGKGIFVLSEEAPEHDHYWIGLDAHPLSKEQRQKLKIDGEQGLVIEEVTPDSPAAKAGLKPQDVLLKAGKRPLSQLSDLAGAIQDAKDQPLQLEVNRDGKTQSITVKPAKRPASNFAFRLLEPESGDRKPSIALLGKPGAESASQQSQEILHALAVESERHSAEDAEAGAQIKKFLEMRREMQQRMRELNAMRESVAANPDNGAAEKIRIQMQETEKQVEAINQQIVHLESSRGNPDREMLARQLSSVRRCASELAEVGRGDDAEHLKSVARELELHLQAIDQARAQSVSPDASSRKILIARGFQQPNVDQVRQSQIQMAIQLLAQAGLQEDAVHIQLKAEALEREQHQRQENSANRSAGQQSDPAVAGLRDQVEQMRREIQELKEALARMSERKN